MKKEGLFDLFRRLQEAAEKSNVRVVIMGGLAVSIYTRPRATLDIDGIADIDDETMDYFLNSARRKGFTWDENNPINRIKGMPFLTLYYRVGGVYVDLFLAKSDFQENALKRSRTVEIEGTRLEVISPEDLILVKLISDRPRDAEDVRQILLENSGDLDFDYLEEWAGQLGVLQFLKDELRSIKGERSKDRDKS